MRINISQMMQQAIGFQQAGQLAKAEPIYRQVLAEQPDHSDALYFLGVLALQVGNKEAALKLIGRAISLNGKSPEYYSSLGVALRSLGRVEDAIAAYYQALAIRPNFAEVLVNLGNALHEAGKQNEAAAAFRRVLELKPNDAGALHGLGTVLHAQGKVNEAIEAFTGATRAKPDFAGAYSNLGNALKDAGKIPEAIAACRQAIAIQPDLPEAHNNYGNALVADGQGRAAIAAYRQALAIRPDFTDAMSNLGELLRKDEQIEAAVAVLSRLVELKPGDARALVELGEALGRAGKMGEAVAACEKALEISPDLFEAYHAMANIYFWNSKLNEAIAAGRKAVALRPKSSTAHSNLGNALVDRGLLDEALTMLRRAVELQPEAGQVHNNLGIALQRMGRPKEAMESYERALERMPKAESIASNRLAMMNYLPEIGRAQILAEHRKWDERFARPVQKNLPVFANERSADRVLRIGYVSADFRMHSVAFFMLPLLLGHDRRQVRITCYSNSILKDRLTEHLRQAADDWREIFQLGDEAAAELVRKDGIDVLVDLAGHTAYNRLMVLARRPAPVQVTYLGYPNTTGMSAMGWRMTDAAADPAGAEAFYVERLLRLPHTAWCFSPLSGSPDINRVGDGQLRLGSFNALPKINRGIMSIWAKILRRVPGATLALKNPATRSAEVGAAMQKMFEEAGGEPGRLEIVTPKPLQKDHLDAYNTIDVALDTFPYHGTTTTCEALWMGVPVVTLAGETHVSRVGVSLLSTLNLGEWIAGNEEEYISIAVGLAEDAGRRAELRRTMRQRMEMSPLMDASGMARDVEAAYRTMWKDWLET